MEARPPAENRHGGAPRGERPASWDAPRLTRADQSRLARATTTQVRLSALRPPLVGVDAKGKQRTRAQQRAAGTKNTALFDIVRFERCAPRGRPVRIARARARVPAERTRSAPDSRGAHLQAAILAKRSHVAKAQQSSCGRGGNERLKPQTFRSYFVDESAFSMATASCTVVMNCAGKMMVEFFSVEISAMVWSVRS